MKQIGDPPDLKIIRAAPDTEPVEFPLMSCVRADWITDELKVATVNV